MHQSVKNMDAGKMKTSSHKLRYNWQKSKSIKGFALCKEVRSAITRKKREVSWRCFEKVVWDAWSQSWRNARKEGNE